MKYLPWLLNNLMSVTRLRKKVVYQRSKYFTLYITNADADMEICKLVKSLYILQTNEVQDFAIITKAVQNSGQKQTWKLIHVRWGYLSIEEIQELSKMTTGSEIPLKHPSFFCKSCVLAKQIRYNLLQPSKQESKSLTMVHIDLIVPIIPIRYNHSRYWLLLTDDAIQITGSELFKSQS